MRVNTGICEAMMGDFSKEASVWCGSAAVIMGGWFPKTRQEMEEIYCQLRRLGLSPGETSKLLEKFMKAWIREMP